MVVKRVPLPASIASLRVLDRVDYDDAFTADTLCDRTPEQWARLGLEHASPSLREPLRFVYNGFRLRPSIRDSPQHVLGWSILTSTPTEIVLGAAFAPIGVTARMIVTSPPGRVVMSTLVRIDGAVGRAVWLPGSLVHRAIVPRLLKRAASISAG